MEFSDELREIAAKSLNNTLELIKIACKCCESGKECYHNCPLVPVASEYRLRTGEENSLK